MNKTITDSKGPLEAGSLKSMFFRLVCWFISEHLLSTAKGPGIVQPQPGRTPGFSQYVRKVKDHKEQEQTRCYRYTGCMRERRGSFLEELCKLLTVLSVNCENIEWAIGTPSHCTL